MHTIPKDKALVLGKTASYTVLNLFHIILLPQPYWDTPSLYPLLGLSAVFKPHSLPSACRGWTRGSTRNKAEVSVNQWIAVKVLQYYEAAVLLGKRWHTPETKVNKNCLDETKKTKKATEVWCSNNLTSNLPDDFPGLMKKSKNKLKGKRKRILTNL